MLFTELLASVDKKKYSVITIIVNCSLKLIVSKDNTSGDWKSYCNISAVKFYRLEELFSSSRLSRRACTGRSDKERDKLNTLSVLAKLSKKEESDYHSKGGKDSVGVLALIASDKYDPDQLNPIGEIYLISIQRRYSF